MQCLLTIGKILENLDRWLVMDEVLPFLPKIPSREPAVLMGILGTYLNLTLVFNVEIFMAYHLLIRYLQIDLGR